MLCLVQLSGACACGLEIGLKYPKYVHRPLWAPPPCDLGLNCLVLLLGIEAYLWVFSGVAEADLRVLSNVK